MRWLLQAVPRPAVAVANSWSVADDARRVLPGVRVEAVLNAVDTDRFAPGPGDGPGLDRLAGLPPAPPGAVRVGLVATYARWKGQDVFLRAPLARLAAAGPAVRGSTWSAGRSTPPPGRSSPATSWSSGRRRAGWPAGSGSSRSSRTRRTCTGSLDVAVHASTRPEPFGLTIAEAMGCGKPVVVAAAGGAAELFTPGHDGLGHAPGDASGVGRRDRPAGRRPGAAGPARGERPADGGRAVFARTVRAGDRGSLRRLPPGLDRVGLGEGGAVTLHLG